MKLKQFIASLLCITQLMGLSVALAEETSADTEAVVAEEVQEAEQATEGEVNPNGEVRVYVSADGSDVNLGTFESPVQTIEKGINLAASLKNSNPEKTVAVTIRGGDYRVKKSVKLNTIHNGTEANPFTIQSYNGEEVKIIGSTELTPRNFKQVTDETILARIPEEARQYIGEYDLSKVGVIFAAYGAALNAGRTTTGYYDFIVDDRAQTLARWPNTGFDRTASVEQSGKDFKGETGANRARGWTKATDAVTYGFFGSEYTGDTIKITSIDADGTLRLANMPSYAASVNKRYYVKNLLEELDMPGEYYIDVKTAKLYYYPPYKISDTQMELATLAEPMFTGEGVENITFKGIRFMNTRDYGLKFNKSKGIIVDDCTFENIGNIAVEFTNSSKCKVVNSTIHNIGGHAIYVTGGDRATLTSSEIVIDNNHIYDFSQVFRTNVPGIYISGVGVTVTNNLIHGSSSQAIWYYGNEHKINYNEFYDLVNEACDAGAIYSGRNYTQRGNEIAYNYFHDIDTTADKGGSIFVCAIYMDDLNSSVNAHHNIMYNCNLGVMYGGGRDNIFDNNILIDCNGGLFMDARGVGWGAYHAAEGGQAYQTIFAVPYDKEPWASRYPELLEATKDLANLGLPMNNSIQNNILYNCATNTVASEMKQYGTYENNYEVYGKDFKADGVNPDDVFVDYENRNFELKEGSDLAKKFPEIASIDMSKIGLREDKADSEKQAAEVHPFKLIYPFNGTKDVSNLGQTFSWEKNGNASKYVVKIAEDPTMENVVLTHETLDTMADIALIPSGGKPYWWTVTAVNETNSLSGEYEQFGAPRLIISSVNEQLDKKELRNNVQILSKLNSAIVEGDTPGTYKKGFKERVQLLLDKATAINNSSTVMQKEVVAVNEEYTELIGSIKDNINYDVVNVGDLLENKSMWVPAANNNSGEGYYTFGSDGTLTLKGPKGKNYYGSLMVYDEPLGDNVAVKFGYKVNVSSNYCVIGLQNGNVFLDGGYKIIIKSGNVEVQKRIQGTTGNVIKANFLNYYISDNKWVDLEFGALKTGIGTYVYLTADGQKVAEFMDTEEPYWTGESRFGFGNPSGDSIDCIASIRAAQD